MTDDLEAILLDCFLAAAALNQILEDDLHRDVLSLTKAARRLVDGRPRGGGRRAGERRALATGPGGACRGR
jgi:hypothetical protein